WTSSLPHWRPIGFHARRMAARRFFNSEAPCSCATTPPARPSPRPSASRPSASGPAFAWRPLAWRWPPWWRRSCVVQDVDAARLGVARPGDDDLEDAHDGRCGRSLHAGAHKGRRGAVCSLKEGARIVDRGRRHAVDAEERQAVRVIGHVDVWRAQVTDDEFDGTDGALERTLPGEITGRIGADKDGFLTHEIANLFLCPYSNRAYVGSLVPAVAASGRSAISSHMRMAALLSESSGSSSNSSHTPTSCFTR